MLNLTDPLHLLEDNFNEVLKIIASEKYVNISDGITLLLNINNKYSVSGEEIIFTDISSKDLSVSVPRKIDRDKLISSLLSQYKINDLEQVKTHLRHNFTQYIKDQKKSNLGKYYTPQSLVDLVSDLVKPYVKAESIILDPAVGLGAFLEPFENNKLMARDVDETAVRILKQ